MKNKQRTYGVMMMIASAVVYSLNTNLTKITTNWEIGLGTITLIRGLWAVPALAFLASRQHLTLRLPFRLMGKVLAFGVLGEVCTSLLLTIASVYLPAGSVTTIHYLYPLFVNLCGVFLFRERPRHSLWIALAVALMGVLLFLEPGGKLSPVGIVAAVGSGMSWTIQMLSLERTELRKLDAIQIMFYQCSLLIPVGILIMLIQREQLNAITWPVLGVTGIASLCCYAVGSRLLTGGVRRIGAGLAAVLGVLEPVSSITLSMLLFHDHINLRQACACAMILLSIAYLLVQDLACKKERT